MSNLTEAELKAIELTAELWNLLVTEVIGNDVTRLSDCEELARDIHSIQHRIMAQSAARAYPDKFRLLGEIINKEKN